MHEGKHICPKIETEARYRMIVDGELDIIMKIIHAERANQGIK